MNSCLYRAVYPLDLLLGQNYIVSIWYAALHMPMASISLGLMRKNRKDHPMNTKQLKTLYVLLILGLGFNAYAMEKEKAPKKRL